jgi:hypothetical protein
MGGSYNAEPEDWNDPDDISNDPYWNNNYTDYEEMEKQEMRYKKDSI